MFVCVRACDCLFVCAGVLPCICVRAGVLPCVCVCGCFALCVCLCVCVRQCVRGVCVCAWKCVYVRVCLFIVIFSSLFTLPSCWSWILMCVCCVCVIIARSYHGLALFQAKCRDVQRLHSVCLRERSLCVFVGGWGTQQAMKHSFHSPLSPLFLVCVCVFPCVCTVQCVHVMDLVMLSVCTAVLVL